MELLDDDFRILTARFGASASLMSLVPWHVLHCWTALVEPRPTEFEAPTVATVGVNTTFVFCRRLAVATGFSLDQLFGTPAALQTLSQKPLAVKSHSTDGNLTKPTFRNLNNGHSASKGPQCPWLGQRQKRSKALGTQGTRRVGHPAELSKWIGDKQFRRVAILSVELFDYLTEHPMVRTVRSWGMYILVKLFYKEVRMNWHKAVEAMRNGHQVRQLSQMYSREIDVGLPEFQIPDINSIAQARVYEVGNSGCKLLNAVTSTGKLVLIFVDLQTDRIIMPTDEQKCALDWVVVGNS